MVGPADGVGTFTVSGDASSSNGLDQYAGTVVTYNIAARVAQRHRKPDW